MVGAPQTFSVPIMADIGPDNYASYAESGIPLAYLFIGSEEDREEYGPAVQEVAKEFKGKVRRRLGSARPHGR